ncbi:TOMM precursor leader peptide-binding protein [Frigoribacterium sp. ACAM 257]|nr:TOMM precursor leader peptide-binding protein [Frigoribacterium sp. ACAM 257]
MPRLSPLRLPARAPVVWRDPSSLQIGVEHVHAVVDHVTAGQAEFLAAVSSGVGAGGISAVVVQVGCDRAEAADLVRRLGPVLLGDSELPSEPGRRPVARLAGRGALVDEVGRLLESCSVGVLREDGESAAAARGRGDGAGPHVGVVVGGLVPDPVVVAEWLRRDVPHVLVRVGDRSVRVGPVVVPGATACARCLHLHDGDLDRAWPAIAGQLVALPVASPPLLVLREAALRTVRRVLAMTKRGLDDGPGAGPGEVVRIDLDTYEVSSSVVRPHPDCGCGAPPGTGSVGARRPGPARSGPTRGGVAPEPA